MKKKSRGFMLAEVVIVGAVIATVLVTLYTSFTRLFNNYDVRNRYYDMDALYAATTIADYLIDELVVYDLLDENGAPFVSVSEDRADLLASIYDTYDVNKVFLVREDKISVLGGQTSINKSFRDYLNNYVDKVLDKDRTNVYILVLERQVSDNDNYYAYVEL